MMKTPQDEATCKDISVKNSQHKTQEAFNNNLEDDLLKIPDLNYKGRQYEELPSPLIYNPQDAANEEKNLTTPTTNQQLMNTQEMKEKTMWEQLQSVEREIALARPELAEKDNIYKNQRKLIAELQYEV